MLPDGRKNSAVLLETPDLISSTPRITPRPSSGEGRARPARRPVSWQHAVLSALVFSATLAQAARGNEEETLHLVPGQQKILSAPGVTRIAIANPNVADVKVVTAGQVLVTAVGVGETELTVWQGSRLASYQIVVTRMDPRELKREVDKLLGNREGMSTRISRDKVYIEGSVLTLPDLEKAEEIARLYPQVQSLVKLDPSAHALIAEALNKQLQRVGLPNARATVVGSTLFLEGMVDSEADLKKAEIITAGIGQNIQSVLRVGSSRMVELDVEFVEIAKNSLDRIGVSWPTDLSGEVSLSYASTTILKGSGPDTATLTGTGSLRGSLGLALQFNDGVTRTLANPRLITASAQSAKFLAGGEVPIPIVTDNRVYIEYKEYGIRLNITPIADGSGAIQTKVLTEISQVDESVTVMGVPGFLTRRVDTEVTVRDGETIVLSGLLHLTEAKDITKVPFFGHLPIIGELFKSRQFRDRQTELVVFVTPRLVDPVSKHLKELSQQILNKYKSAEDDVSFSLFD